VLTASHFSSLKLKCHCASFVPTFDAFCHRPESPDPQRPSGRAPTFCGAWMRQLFRDYQRLVVVRRTIVEFDLESPQ